jgi:Ran GTPase-activating protein (RanGAP) involved in mRNA processing and transport
MSEISDAKSNPIVDEFLRKSKVVNLNRVDLSNSHNLFCVINSIEKAELSNKKDVFNLEHCKISHKNIEALYAALSRNISTPFHICLSWNKLGEKGMIPMRNLFSPSLTMIRLYLDGNNIGDMGVHSLLRAMEAVQAKLTHLSLNLNNIGTSGMLCLADKFSAALGSITWLSLSQNDMSGKDVAQSIAIALSSSRTLKDLDLSSTRLGAEGASAIAHYLIGKNRFLKSLDLTNNNMKDVGAHALSLALQLNNVMSRLRIGSNNIGPSGCASLVEGLQVNETLKELDLSRTHASQVALGVEGARQIAHMLQLNRGLTSLNLYWCNLQCAGGLLIASALEDNKTITKINLGGNYIGPAAILRLLECMSPMYRLGDEHLRMSAWDSNVPSTPFLLNRKTRLAARRPQSASATSRRPTMTPSPTIATRKAIRGTVNVNSRKSVLIKKPPSELFVRPASATTPKATIKDLFAVTPKTTRSYNAMLPEIRDSLLAMDSIVAKENALEKASPTRLLQHIKKWEDADLSPGQIVVTPSSPMGLLFKCS